MKTSILGSGVYAKAISACLLNANCTVTMWTEKKDFKEVLARERTYLTNSFEDAADADIIFVLTSSPFVASVLEGIAPHVDESSLIVVGSKGILEDGTLMTDLVEKILPKNHYAVISGPTFAVDIAALEPVGFTIGTKSFSDFEKIVPCFKTAHLEYSSDVLAIEMCGSLKNAYAIGSGLLNGLNYGHSTSCLYITKALHEMSSIFGCLDASPHSTNTLAGVGDLVLTCTSQNSRNFTFGTVLALGDETQKKDYLQKNTVEGYENLKAYVKLFARKNVAAPLLSCVNDIVEGRSEPEKIIELLLDKKV